MLYIAIQGRNTWKSKSMHIKLNNGNIKKIAIQAVYDMPKHLAQKSKDTRTENDKNRQTKNANKEK